MATLLKINGEHLIRLPIDDSKSNYLNGFWRWVEFLANDDYERAVESLYWPHQPSWTWSPAEIWMPDKYFYTPEILKDRVTTFFGGDDPWSVVIPNERLVGVIDNDATYYPQVEGIGYLMAQIPLTTEPDNPKNDEILLMGLASIFNIIEHDGHYVLNFILFHI